MQTAISRLETPGVCMLSAVEMARRIRAKDLSAREVLAAHLQQIVRVNPSVNAIVTLAAGRAIEQARRADEALARGEPAGPLHGLPIAHKDLQPTAGIRTTFGSRIYQDFVPAADSLLVERIRNAGAILVGKTNTPEFGAGSQTFNEVSGATRNPYDLTRTCGGSSGGAAVALACRMLPIADGSDLASSVRNPASFCNVVGFRPSLGRLPAQPVAGWSSMSVDGPMARSVADAAFFFAAVAGPDLPSAPLQRDFKGVRVAWWKDLGGLPVDPPVREITNAQRRVFESLGCIVEDAEPDFAGADETFKVLRSWQVYQSLTALPKGDPRKQRELVKDTVLWELDRGEKRTADEIAQAEAQRAELRRRVARFMQRYEFFVLPVSQALPFDVTQPYPSEIAGVPMTTYIDWMKSCYYVTLTGHPAMSVPAGFTAEGLPVGLQIVSRYRDDWGLLQMGHAFEQAANVSPSLPPAQ